MYSVLPFALATGLIEIPYIAFQTVTYSLIGAPQSMPRSPPVLSQPLSVMAVAPDCSVALSAVSCLSRPAVTHSVAVYAMVQFVWTAPKYFW